MTTTSQLAQEVPALVPPPALYWPTSSPTVPGTLGSMLTGEAALSAVSFKNIRNPNPILFRSVQSVLLQPQTNLTVNLLTCDPINQFLAYWEIRYCGHTADSADIRLTYGG